MLETVGKKLAKARKAKNLEIEDIEHRTRIPHDRLRELEDDDYSRFANLTYAKSFLKIYSDYLGVDTSEYRQELSLYEVDDFGSDPLANEFAVEEKPKPRTGIFVGIGLLLLAAIAGVYFVTEHFRKELEKESAKPLAAQKGDSEEQDPGAKPPGEVPEEPLLVPEDEEDPTTVVPAVVIEDEVPAPAIPVNPDR